MAKYEIKDPMGVVLWVFLASAEDLARLLTLVSRFPEDERSKQVGNWEQAAARAKELSNSPLTAASVRDVEGPVRAWCDQTSALLKAISTQLPNPRFAMVPTECLVMPLTLVDFQYVEQLKGSLTGTSPEDVARFALPNQVPVHVKTGFDPSGRAVNVVSSDPILALGPMVVNQLEGVGLEVVMRIVGVPQLVLVSKVGDRLYLRGGIHRAYLLASLGLKEIPCVLVTEERIPQIIGAYPTFAPDALAAPRPPLLRDALDPTTSLLIPLVRTARVFRISAEEIVVPIN